MPKDQVRKIESAIHTKLKRQGRHHKKEFFEISVTEAKKVVEETLNHFGLLELSRTRESERLDRLRNYYARKNAAIREAREEEAQKRKQEKITSTISHFKVLLTAHLINEHPVMTKWTPIALGAISLVVSVAILLDSDQFGPISGNWFWIIFVPAVVYSVTKNSFEERVSKKNVNLIESKINAVKEALESGRENVDAFTVEHFKKYF